MHKVVLTVDVDWAPDWAMAQLLQKLVDTQTPSTWFVTHESQMLEELRAHPSLVEIGIHPNFLAGSSHGNSPAEIMAECMRIAPEARTMRTHCLVQSTPIFQVVADSSPIKIDTSIYLRDATGVSASALPLDHGRSLTRFAYVWEDDLEFFADEPRWDAASLLTARHSAEEITIIDVHPIHYALNSANVGPYEELKKSHGGTRHVTAEDAARFRNEGEGAQSFITSLTEVQQILDIELLKLSELAAVVRS